MPQEKCFLDWDPYRGFLVSTLLLIVWLLPLCWMRSLRSWEKIEGLDWGNTENKIFQFRPIVRIYFFLMKWRLHLRHLMYLLVHCIVLAPAYPTVNLTEINLTLQVASFKQVEASHKVFLTVSKRTRFWKAFPCYWLVKKNILFPKGT